METIENEFAFVQKMDVKAAQDAVDKALHCVCLRWSTYHETNNTMHQTCRKKIKFATGGRMV